MLDPAPGVWPPARPLPTETTKGRRLLELNWETLRDEWLGNARADMIAGLVVALALIPEAIAFSIIARVQMS